MTHRRSPGRKPFFLLIVLISVQSLLAQPCTPELMAARPGRWKAGPQGSIRNIAPADLARERSFLQNLQKRISSVYAPLGLEVHYSTVWNKGDKQGYAADPYHLAMYLLRYLCDDSPKGFYVEYASGTNVMVAVNQLFALEDLDAAPMEPDHFRGYLRFFNKPVRRDGAIFMGAELYDNGRIREENWLITKGDSLPFRMLTRKEFLLLTRAKLEQQIQKGSDDLQTYLNKVIAGLGASESELSLTAVCNTRDEERFTGFLEEGDRFAFYPVVPDMSYYKKGLPRSAAQFISVKFKYGFGDPVFDTNMEALRHALDFSYLHGLLVK